MDVGVTKVTTLPTCWSVSGVLDPKRPVFIVNEQRRQRRLSLWPAGRRTRRD